MEFDFNNIKNSMREANQEPLPSELDWRNMKEGIFDKIQSIEQEEAAQRNNKRFGRRSLLFILLLFALTLGLFSFFQSMIKDQNSVVQHEPKLAETTRQNPASNNTNNLVVPNQIQPSEESPIKKRGKSEGNDQFLTYEESDLNQDSKKYEIAQRSIDPSKKDTEGNRNEPSSKVLDKGLFEASQNTHGTGEKTTRFLVENRRPELSAQITELQALVPYMFEQISLGKRKYSFDDIQKIVESKHAEKGQEKFPDRLIVEGGISFWNEGFGKMRPERAQYEVPLTSFQLQGHYMKSINRNYFLMAGLQYQQLESKLRYNNIIEDYKVTIRDTIIQIQNNVITGEQRVIRGDIEQLVQAERRVRHYNRTQLFKLSLALGKNWRFHSFQTDVYLGGALNTLVQNQGKMFYEGEIVDYKAASNSFFSNQWMLDGVLGLRLHYFLSQNIGISTGFQAQKSLMNWSNDTHINFYPASYSLQMGLTYSLY